MTLGHYIHFMTSRLNSDSAYLEVELLMAHVLGCTRVQLYTKWDQTLDKKSTQQFIELFNKRQVGEPLAYLLGNKEFYGNKFYVEPGVFIPRPETETIISSIVDMASKQEELNIVDFGSGSGCIGLSLLLHFPNARLLSVDLSEKAVQIGQKNANKLRLTHRVCFIKKSVSDLLKSDWPFSLKKGINMIVANPPYIAFDDLRVEEDVCLFEPALALFSRDRGLFHIHTWFQQACELLESNGYYFFEIGAEQNFSFLNNLENKMKFFNQFRDLSGTIRVMSFQKTYG